ncbi:MAG: ATP-grasp domain-containing protein [Candidatus Bathyarchaeia archaeon]
MQILILYGNAFNMNAKELADNAENLGHKVFVGRILDLSSFVSKKESRFWLEGEDVTDVDICFVRSFGPGSCEQLTRRISMIEHMELSGIRVVNPCYAFRRARDKYATQYMLSISGLPTVETYTTEDLESAYEWTKNLGEFVYKPILGSMGRGSLKFEDPDLAYNAWKTLSRLSQPILIQKFIKNPGRDIRVFVVGEEAIGVAFKYPAPGMWKTNVAQGGTMKSDSVPTEYIELAVKATRVLGLDYAGVDLLESDEGPIILEVNGSPGWQALKESTGVDVAKKIIEYATGLLEV